MRIIYRLILGGVYFVLMASITYAQDIRKEPLQVAHNFFAALEKGDSTSFRALFVPNAMVYTVREKDGLPVVGSRSPFKDSFRPGTVIKERMKATGVEARVHGQMAVLWVPYNLWVNDVFSHCGIDVFTLVNTTEGWRIASLSYSIEKEGCEIP